MIEFDPASLTGSPDDSGFWQGLNAASVALQQAAQSEAAVYQVFCEQLIKLGLHGTINMLDDSRTQLKIASIVFSERLMKLVRKGEKLANIKALDYSYSVEAVQANQVVVNEQKIVFLPNNNENMSQVIPPHIFRFVAPLLKPILNIPAVLAPIYEQSVVIGVLYLSGRHLQIEHVPAISAFSNHLSIALQNARLFQAVEEAEQKYRRLFESANDGIFLYDQDSRQLLSANSKMLDLLGIAKEGLGAVRPSAWATPEMNLLYQQHLNLAIKNGSHFFEIPVVDRQGIQRHWQISATIIELKGKKVLNGFVRDITERVQAEEQQKKLSATLTQQTKLLEAILAATPDNFLVFGLDGRFLFVSPAILNFLGTAVEFVVGRTWQELHLPEEFGNLSDLDRATVLKTGHPVSREIRYPTPEGTREIEFITNPVRDDGGAVTSFVTTARDVTERRQTARAMHRAQKMESLGLLAGGIAHDFNNLLVAMLGQASLAQAHLAPDHPAYGHVSKAVLAAEQAAALTRQLLAYSGGGQFTIKPININTLIKESVDLLMVALPKQIQLQLNLAEGLPPIEADIAQMQQVIMNLVINASEAMAEQVGTIQVQTAVRTLTPNDDAYWRYTDRPLSPGNYVCLSVQDSGCGMENDTIAKIFDPFFTTKFTGRGLGLAAVLGIMRSHQGGLLVASQPTIGTTFELLFPVSEAAAVLQHEEPMALETAVSSVVLVIDDEPSVREAVTDILEMEGIGALTAANGDEGIAQYKAQAHTIDLVLLDLSMPGKSGQETFLELQKFDPNVRIMLSSGYSEADATRGFSSPPLVGFLQKPYRLDAFVQVIRRALTSSHA